MEKIEPAWSSSEAASLMKSALASLHHDKLTQGKGSIKLEKRDSDVGVPVARLLGALQDHLHVGFTPDVMLAREREHCVLRDFVTSCVSQKRGGSLYVCGAPGTGKTASVRSVLDSLSAHCVRVEINAAGCTDAATTYRRILSALLPPGQAVPSSTGAVTAALEARLVPTSATVRRAPVVLVVDEVDQILAGLRTPVYRLFEWAARRGSVLALVAIANAVDLTERLLPDLRRRHCEPAVLVFAPYTAESTSALLAQRLALAEAAAFADCDDGAAGTPPPSSPRQPPRMPSVKRTRAVAVARRRARRPPGRGLLVPRAARRPPAVPWGNGSSDTDDHGSGNVSDTASEGFRSRAEANVGGTTTVRSAASSVVSGGPAARGDQSSAGEAAAGAEADRAAGFVVHAQRVMSAAALGLLATRIGGVSGDVRRAMELCRSACEHALRAREGEWTPGKDGPCVLPEHSQAAVRHALASKHVGAIAALPTLAQTLLCVAVELSAAAVGAVTVAQVHKAHTALARHQGTPPLTRAQACDVVARLRDTGLVSLKPAALPRVSGSGGTGAGAATGRLALAPATRRLLARRGKGRARPRVRGGAAPGASPAGTTCVGSGDGGDVIAPCVTALDLDAALEGTAMEAAVLRPVRTTLRAQTARVRALEAEALRQEAEQRRALESLAQAPVPGPRRKRRRAAAVAKGEKAASTDCSSVDVGGSRAGTDAGTDASSTGGARTVTNRVNATELLGVMGGSTTVSGRLQRAAKELAMASHPSFGMGGRDAPLPYRPQQMSRALARATAADVAAVAMQDEEGEGDVVDGVQQQEAPSTPDLSAEDVKDAEGELAGIFAVW